MLNLQNIKERILNLNEYDVNSFQNDNNSFPKFITKLRIDSFRNLNNLDINFKHPITIISGINKIGKTSILLLLACSHERFLKLHATKPATQLVEHSWRDIIRFTQHENSDQNYQYQMWWREGNAPLKNGTGKRIAGTGAWTGLAKKSSTPRTNAKIKRREVRLIDLERIAPARSFSNSLFYKSNRTQLRRLDEDIEKAFAYIFDLTSVELSEAGSHINKRCYLIKSNDGNAYSSYGSASGEEAVINILRDIIESEKNSLILIDELEAAFHPLIQRKLADIIQFISWEHKKQFIITTHSPTLLSSFDKKSRRFIEKSLLGELRAIEKISQAAAFSKMDSMAHPLIYLYCEDRIAQFIVSKIINIIVANHPSFNKMINIIPSGPADQVRNDYERHKHNYPQMHRKIGYGAVFDGDYKEKAGYSSYYNNANEYSFFLFPYMAPEKFLAKAYLQENPSNELESFLTHQNHHSVFRKMHELGMAADEADARNLCFACFEQTDDFLTFKDNFKQFLTRTITHFSEEGD